MKLRFASLAAFILCTAAAAAQISSPTLRCTIPATRAGDFDDLVRPATPQETARMRDAPEPATRVGHRLLVQWAGGVHVFRDKPPFDAPLDGLDWTYCGFSPRFGVHLIGKRDGDLFTGVLLTEKTGAVLPAGEEIRFSPNHRLYLASEQPDGQDGPTLRIYRSDGHLVWKGYGGMLTPDAVDFVSAEWNAHNQVTVQVTTRSGKPGTETLTRVKGRWQWLPRLVPNSEPPHP